ncbi:MAG: phenylalanine--tRNA ligase subunit alpha, partial [Leadbetterella sp.]
MLDNIHQLKKEAETTFSNKSLNKEEFRLKYLSKKGLLNDLFDKFKAVPNDQKKHIGGELNVLK